ncbi:immunoglobulin-like domain-containing protein, partial [Enterococcus mundtii]|uniref:immunoglobulin-like domain-containing protein n=1 Tax=Enterococcus mundtii TaxID=53346 RepID=UPI000CF12FE4
MSKKKLTKKRKKQLLAMFMTAGMMTNTFVGTGLALADEVTTNSTTTSGLSDSKENTNEKQQITTNSSGNRFLNTKITSGEYYYGESKTIKGTCEPFFSVSAFKGESATGVSTTVTADLLGNFEITILENMIQPGDVIRVRSVDATGLFGSDDTTYVHYSTPKVSNSYAYNSPITGTAYPGSEVYISDDPSFASGWVTATTDGSGNFSASSNQLKSLAGYASGKTMYIRSGAAGSNNNVSGLLSHTVSTHITEDKSTITANNFTLDYGSAYNSNIAIQMSGVRATDANGNDVTNNVQVSGNVNTKIPGNYNVTFTSPESGKSTTVVATVKDAPADNATITANNATVEYGSTWNDSVAKQVTGVKATDKYGNDVTNNVTVSGDVDTKKPGNYNVTFTSPESGKSKTVVITVKDAPADNATITANNATVEYGSTWNDSVAKQVTGVKATDRYGNDVTNNVIVSGNVDTKKPGNYNVTFTSPESGKSTTVVITVKEGVKAETPVFDTPYIYGDDLRGKTSPNATVRLRINSLGVIDITVQADENGDFSIPVEKLKQYENYKVGSKLFADASFGTDSSISEMGIVIVEENHTSIEANDFEVDYGFDLTDEAAIEKAGVKATDKYGESEGVKVKESNVDTSKPGEYSITFVSDSGKEKTVKVTVKNKPIIGSEPIIHATDMTYQVGETLNPLLGVTAEDPEDGDLTDQVKADASGVNMSKVGDYELKLSVTDKDGNTTEQTVTIHVVDQVTDGPVIKGADDVRVDERAKFDPLEGVTAQDSQGNDVTDNLTYTGSVDTSTPGEYTIKYYVYDKAGKVATAERVVTVQSDASKPVVMSPDKLTIKQNSKFDPTLYAQAYDNEDGDITDQIKVLGQIYTDKLGSQFITYEVTDSDGNKATKMMEVEVVATLGNAPVISGADDLEINVGDTFDPISGVTAYDNEDGDLTSEIKYGGIVDTGKAGEYTVTYTVWDSDFNVETVERKVTVKDPTVEPAIEAHDFEVDYGFDLTDEAAIEKAEAKATDKYGKEEAVTVKETNVDTSKPGEYSITFVS